MTTGPPTPGYGPPYFGPPYYGPPYGGAALPPPLLIDRDAPCRKCAYNLRGLTVDARCPECGTPAGLSLQGDLLRFSEPAWVDTLARGVSLNLWGFLVMLVAMGIAVALSIFGVQFIGQLVTFAGGLVTVYGSWLLTEPDPSGIGEDRYGTARKVIRVSLITGLVSNVLDIVEPNVDIDVPLYRDLLNALRMVFGIIWVVGFFSLMLYLSRLADRIPDPALVARARLLMYGLGVSLAAVVVLGGIVGFLAFRTAGANQTPGAGFFVAGCGAGIALLAVVAFGIVYLIFLFRLRRALRGQAAIARQTWARVAFVPGGGG